MINSKGELKVRFGYQCNGHGGPNGYNIIPRTRIQKTSSFSCLSGAAFSANATLANTSICNGLIGAEILPSLNSPKSFRRVPFSPSLSRLDMLSSSLQSSLSILCCSPSSPSDQPLYDSYLSKPLIALSRSEGFLNGMEIQVAGGVVGEDSVQAVCSGKQGLLFSAIYDGFNRRDADDFLAGTLYESVMFYSNLFKWESKSDAIRASDGSDFGGPQQYVFNDNNKDPGVNIFGN